MIEIYNQEPYQIKASRELKKELNDKIREKVALYIWHIADEARAYGLNLDISAGILASERVALYFTDRNTGAMFDTAAFPLALYIAPCFKYGEEYEVTGIVSIEIQPADVDNWEEYFKIFNRVKGCLSFLPKARGVC